MPNDAGEDAVGEGGLQMCIEVHPYLAKAFPNVGFSSWGDPLSVVKKIPGREKNKQAMYCTPCCVCELERLLTYKQQRTSVGDACMHAFRSAKCVLYYSTAVYMAVQAFAIPCCFPSPSLTEVVHELVVVAYHVVCGAREHLRNVREVPRSVEKKRKKYIYTIEQNNKYK